MATAKIVYALQNVGLCVPEERIADPNLGVKKLREKSAKTLQGLGMRTSSCARANMLGIKGQVQTDNAVLAEIRLDQSETPGDDNS